MFILLVIQYFIQYRVQPQNIWTECKMFTKAHIYIQLQASIPNLLTILRLLANWPRSKIFWHKYEVSLHGLHIYPNKTIFYWQLWYSYNKTKSMQMCKKYHTDFWNYYVSWWRTP